MILPTLYARAASGAINEWTISTEGPDVFTTHGQVGGAMQIACYRAVAKNIGRANATTAEEQAIAEARAKWDKQRKRKYFLTIAETAALNVKPMLAAKFNDHAAKVSYPVIVQPKLDGVRCLAYREGGRVVLHSRGGETYDVEHIRAALESRLAEDVVLDGEIYVHGMPLQQIVSLVKRPQAGSAALEYHVYDVTSLSDQSAIQSDREDVRAVWFLRHGGGPLRRVDSILASCEAEVREFHNSYVRAGYEGAIIRTMGGVYRFGYRSRDLLKLKAFDDHEYEIVGVRTGKGAAAEMPVFTCRTATCAEFECMPRGTAEIRRDLLARASSLIGKRLTVRHFGVTLDGVPRFPVGIAVREEGT